MPPVLDPAKSHVDGLAFLGLSLQRHSAELGHPDSATHQTQFDLNQVQDREYKYLFSTNDDGWLVGGGEPGPPQSYKLPAKDSAHVEIMRIGTYNKAWGGVPVDEIVTAIASGKILIPEITVVPTAVVANPDAPPELEIRFDMDPALEQVPKIGDEEDDAFTTTPLPANWQLRFLHNQLFRYFQFPSRFCPGPFHSTILRKAEFRSPEHRDQYFAKCEKAVKEWKAVGPQPLVPVKIEDSVKQVTCEVSPDEPIFEGQETGEAHQSSECRSGLWLYTDRTQITHQFAPNFLPPYNTVAKRKLIWQFLREEWDEPTLAWHPVGKGPAAGVVAGVVEEYEARNKSAKPTPHDDPHEKHHDASSPPTPPRPLPPHHQHKDEKKEEEKDDHHHPPHHPHKHTEDTNAGVTTTSSTPNEAGSTTGNDEKDTTEVKDTGDDTDDKVSASKDVPAASTTTTSTTANVTTVDKANNNSKKSDGHKQPADLVDSLLNGDGCFLEVCGGVVNERQCMD